MATCVRELQYRDEFGDWHNASLEFLSSVTWYNFDIGGKKISISSEELSAIIGLTKILNRFDSVFPCTQDEEYNLKMVDDIFNSFGIREAIGNKEEKF